MVHAVGRKSNRRLAVIVLALIGVGLIALDPFGLRSGPAVRGADPARQARAGTRDPSLVGQGETVVRPGPETPHAPSAPSRAADPTPHAADAPPLADRRNAPGADATTPPDVLEGTLFDGDAPIGEGTGLLWRGQNATTAGSIPVGDEPQERALVTRDGLIRFAGLEAGPWYLGVDLGDGVQRLAYLQRTTGVTDNPRILLGLGHAAVAGTVWGEDGAPVVGAVVRVGPAVASVRGVLLAQTKTDRDGVYEIRRLSAGPAWVTFALTGDLDDETTTHHRRVALEEGRVTTLDFGTARGLVAFQGTVRCEDGTAVTGGGQIILSTKQPSGFLIVRFDAEGHYVQRVAEGVYDVSIWPPGASGLEAYRRETPLSLSGTQVNEDLVLPGARIVGALDPVPAGPATTYLRVQRKADAAGAVRPGSGRSVAVGEDGRYAVFGLAPGTYVVETGPRRAEPANVEIVEGQAEARVDLRLE